MAYTNFCTSCRTTYNLGSQEIRKYQENLKNSQNNSPVPSLPAKMKILLILAKRYILYEAIVMSCSVVMFMYV